MTEKSTIARPYAKALFELALAQQKLQPWSQALAAAAAVAADARVRKLLTSPHVSATQLGQFMIDLVERVLGREADDAIKKNGLNGQMWAAFVRTLAANRRLGLLPEIAARFEKLKAEFENQMDVTITATAPLTAEQERQYATALKRRFQRDVRLHQVIDPSLLGGAILRADDLVIDGSLRGRLERLGAAMAS
jgi:F-type H+-transporting ATPase subunit delta